MKELVRGELYQVKSHSGWIIAEYVSFAAAHIARGINLRGESSWREPDTHYWKGVTGGSFRIAAKGMQVRDVTADTLADIAHLRAEIERTGKEQQAFRKELYALCN